MLFQGLSVHKLAAYVSALPTPFLPDGAVDYAALEGLCDRLVLQGVHGLAVCGAIGEAPTLTRSEYAEIIRIASQISRGRVPIIASACSNATGEAIAFARDA